MNASATAFLRLALIAALMLAAAAPASAGSLRAGAAEADITPPIGTPMFAYTDRSRVFNPANNSDVLQVLADPDTDLYAKTFIPSKGVQTRLRARAVVIERNGVPYALAQVDLGGIPYAVTQAVAARVAGLGITQDRLLLSATHTHSGHGAIWPYEDNAAYGFVGGDVFDKRIFKLTVDGIADAITRAHAKLVRARVGVGRTTLTDASRNRASEAFAADATKPDTPVDPGLTVIRVDAADGKPIAVWSNFAIHATSISDPILSGDNPGATARIVEHEIGRGVVHVWTNGNEGDISPNDSPDVVDGQPAEYVESGFASADMAGQRVARGVLAAWRAAGPALQRDIDLEASQGYMPLDGTKADGEPVGPVPVLGASVVAGDGTCSPIDNSAGPGQGHKMFLFGSPGIVPGVAPVSIWRVGDLGIAALPTEVTWTMGSRIRSAIEAASGGRLARVIIAGLTDGYLSYTATPEEYDKCGYEGGMTLFGRRQGARYRDYSSGLAAHLLTGAPAPVGAPEPARTGFGLDQGPPPHNSPKAGTVVAQPAARIARYGKAVFRWKGGDRAVDEPRGQAFVTLEQQRRAGWKPFATDDSYADIVTRYKGDEYEDVFQLGPCEPRGTYRFVVTGRAVKGGKVRDYRATSRPFQLVAATLTAEPRAGGGYRVLYPHPATANLALPRIAAASVAEPHFTDACGNATG